MEDGAKYLIDLFHLNQTFITLSHWLIDQNYHFFFYQFKFLGLIVTYGISSKRKFNHLDHTCLSKSKSKSFFRKIFCNLTKNIQQVTSQIKSAHKSAHKLAHNLYCPSYQQPIPYFCQISPTKWSLPTNWRSYLLRPLYAAPPSQQVGSTGVWAPPIVGGGGGAAYSGHRWSFFHKLSISLTKLSPHIPSLI